MCDDDMCSSWYLEMVMQTTTLHVVLCRVVVGRGIVSRISYDNVTPKGEAWGGVTHKLRDQPVLPLLHFMRAHRTSRVELVKAHRLSCSVF